MTDLSVGIPQLDVLPPFASTQTMHLRSKGRHFSWSLVYPQYVPSHLYLDWSRHCLYHVPFATQTFLGIARGREKKEEKKKKNKKKKGNPCFY